MLRIGREPASFRFQRDCFVCAAVGTGFGSRRPVGLSCDEWAADEWAISPGSRVGPAAVSGEPVNPLRAALPGPEDSAVCAGFFRLRRRFLRRLRVGPFPCGPWPSEGLLTPNSFRRRAVRQRQFMVAFTVPLRFENARQNWNPGGRKSSRAMQWLHCAAPADISAVVQTRLSN